MPERSSAIPAWAWIVGAVLAIVSIFAGYRMVQTQQHLVAAQSELESAKQAVEKANAERNELQSKLEDATSEVGSAQSVLAETKPVLAAAQSELKAKYRKQDAPWLATEEYGPDDPDAPMTLSEFRNVAWAAADDAARQLGWIKSCHELHGAAKLARTAMGRNSWKE